MQDFFALVAHVFVTLIRILGPGGARSIVAESTARGWMRRDATFPFTYDECSDIGAAMRAIQEGTLGPAFKMLSLVVQVRRHQYVPEN